MKAFLFFSGLFVFLSFSGFSQTYIGFTYTSPPLPVVDAGNDTLVSPGSSFLLQGSISDGTAPFTHYWQPGVYLDDSTLLTPEATISSDVSFTLTVIDSNGCEVWDQVNIAVDETMIAEHGEADPVVYPNPSSGSFTISGLSSSDNQVTIHCYSIFGSLIAVNQYAIKGSKVTVDLQVPPGVYFLKITTSNKQYRQRIMLQ